MAKTEHQPAEMIRPRTLAPTNSELITGEFSNAWIHQVLSYRVLTQRSSVNSRIFAKTTIPLLDFLLGRADHAAHVKPAFWADDVRWNGRATLRANRQLFPGEGVVGTTFSRSGIGVFSFWNSHLKSLQLGGLKIEIFSKSWFLIANPFLVPVLGSLELYRPITNASTPQNPVF